MALLRHAVPVEPQPSRLSDEIRRWLIYAVAQAALDLCHLFRHHQGSFYHRRSRADNALGVCLENPSLRDDFVPMGHNEA
jgi:hypothetical protein